ncbi:MAG: glycosyltransferase family 2 protein [Candidatus Bathyarchaeia archaeon]
MDKIHHENKKFSDEPIISVVMPSYNHENYIDYAINSVTSQGIKNLELIIVDDFSSDNSQRIIRRWTEEDNRIKAIFHSKNEGIARTINDGIKAARGKYIALMASDDMFKQGAFEKVIAVLESSEDLGVAMIEGECIDNKNRRMGVLFSELYRKPSTERGNFFKDLAIGNFVCTGVVRRSIIEKYQIFYCEELKYLNDWLFWLDLSNVCDFAFISEPLYYYRIHGANTSLSYNNMMVYDGLKAIDMVLSKYGKILDNKSKDRLLRWKGRSYIVLHNYKRAREHFYMCLHLNSSLLNNSKTTLYILFTYFPRLFGYHMGLLGRLKKQTYKEKKILEKILHVSWASR